VGIGEAFWPNYARDLRADPAEPTCDLADIRTKLAECPAEGEAAPATEGGADPFAGEDPFADEGEALAEDPFAGEDPFAEADEEDSEASPKDPFAGEDPFADEGEPAAGGADPFAGEDPFAEEGEGSDPFGGGDPFAEDKPTKPKVNCAALRNLADRCEIRHAAFDDIQTRLTPGVKQFRTFELVIASLAKFPFWKHLLVILVLLGGFATTAHRAHIALREPRNRVEHLVTQSAQLLSHLLLAMSCAFDWQVQQNSSAELQDPALPVIWGVGFMVLAGVNTLNMSRSPTADEGPTSPTRLAMVVPLYAWMVMIGGVWFLLLEGHWSGQAIYLHKFAQIPSIYLGIGLYIWAGMLMSQTRIARRFFDLLLPFNMPPALLAWVVVLLSAIPTAYSGASGIFVIAAGAVIFERLTAAGAPKRLALAATAMSGSLGVVLRPCLVVVLIAMLNKQVTTDELFERGLQVFVLTATLFLLAMLLVNREGFRLAPLGEALPEVGRAFVRILPYFVVAGAVMLFYGVVLDTRLSEHTAPFIMPGLMLSLVIYDRLFVASVPEEDGDSTEGLWPALFEATHESSSHVGALLTVMFASVGLGGVVERSDFMAILPEQFGSTFLTMSLLVVVMVLIGMTMDALGAVVLVSVSVSKVAYDNGIDPVHFWIMVLVAFELGYLTPPVALNHLLARQVIGEAAKVEDDPQPTFYLRYEHLIVPVAVMGTALILVAFVPLAFY
jgi:TRAP-type C4-dicarboxylate transport system permease large subunit